MADRPTGTVTFLFTDIEGSTKLAQAYPAEWEVARQRHHAILSEATEAHQGFVFQIIGDAFCVAFHNASDAIAASVSAQRDLQAEAWGETPLRVRMGLHTGAAEFCDGEYQGYLTLVRVQRVMSAAFGGQMLLSGTSAELLREGLPADSTLRDLGEHGLKGLLTTERLWQVIAPGLRHDFPALPSLSVTPHNLPVQLTSFVGREHEMAEIKRLLAVTRLLTLTGVGGTGKTRLSLQVAAELLDQFPAGVWLAELAPLVDPEFVPQAVASALNVSEQPGRPITATLTDYLRDKRLLLILDNCEHLLNACARLADAVLHGCPRVRILTSSREALGIGGEYTYAVPSLTLPDPSQIATPDVLMQSQAVQLFVERAVAASSRFAVTPANAKALTQVCRRLDGIPLAIELAAARVKGLSVEQIAARLDNSFQLLTGGSRTALPRQQTLRALIDWSYNLLSEPEQRLLQRLSVFAGGWNLEAAEAICAGEGIEQRKVLDLLLSLQSKSLIATEEREGHQRYRLLETVRQYARDKLMESGESEQVRDCHLAYFLQVAEGAEPKMRSAEHSAALAMLDEDFDNIRAAIARAADRDSLAGLRLVGALYFFWSGKGYFHEGRVLAERALSSSGALPGSGRDASADSSRESMVSAQQTRAEVKALLTAVALAFMQGDYLVAQSQIRDAEARAREIDDPTILGHLLIHQGLLKLYQGDHDGARALYEQNVILARQDRDAWGLAYALWFLGDALTIDDRARALLVYEESLTLFRQVGDHYFLGLPLTSLGHLLMEDGDYAKARALLTEGLTIRRAHGDRYFTATSLNSLAEVMSRQQDYESAAALCEESLALNRNLGNKSGIAWSLRNQAEVAGGRGDVQNAEVLLRESLSLYRELGQMRDATQVIEALAQSAHGQGRHTHAARLWGAADALRQAANAPRSLNLRGVYDQNVATARTELGDVAFDAAFAAGRNLTMEQTIALALGREGEPPIFGGPSEKEITA